MAIASVSTDSIRSPRYSRQLQQHRRLDGGAILFNLEINDNGACLSYALTIARPQPIAKRRLTELVDWWGRQFVEEGVIDAIDETADLDEVFFIMLAAPCWSYQRRHPSASVGEVVAQVSTIILPAATMLCNLHPGVVVFEAELSYFSHDHIMIPDAILYLEE